MKITVDTNFLISATQWDYSVSFKLLTLMIQKNISVFSSEEILEEFSKVLMRDFKVSEEELHHIIKKILEFVTLIEPKIEITEVKDDPDDNKILECAVASGSESIITYDKHLLNIREYNGIKMIKPEDAFRLIE